MKTNKINNTEWNLGLFYSSINDPRIEKDMVELDNLCENFSKKYSDKLFLNDKIQLEQALKDYFHIESKLPAKPIMFLSFTISKDHSNNKAQSLLNLLENRAIKSLNKVTFFPIEIGKISKEKHDDILNDQSLSYYRYFLSCAFYDAQYTLSELEERVLNLKRLPSSDMWNNSHDKVLSSITVAWKGKALPLAEAQNLVKSLKKSDRAKLWKLITTEFRRVSFFSEAEMNAVVTDKKINDELRGFKTPHESTVVSYRNDPKTVDTLVDTVSKNFKVSHKFYKIKAKLLKLNKLEYSDRNVDYKKVTGDFSFEKSKERLLKVFNDFDPKYSKIFADYISNGQIDVYSKKGKDGGAYCWGTYQNPTFVLLNHANNLISYCTIAHEMGHAFHTEFAKSQGPVYCQYSTSTAETASTFFETLALEAIVETLPESQKIAALHDKISSDVQTIFRQIACYNFEKEIHKTVREEGFISKEKLAELHNKHMSQYLGPAFKLQEDDGYFFVQWRHIRNFFYVYTYAYGLLVSKVLLKKYKEDKNFKDSIEKFLISGGNDTPENIFDKIGINVRSPEFFLEGIKEIEKDISNLEKMIRRLK